MKTLFIGLGAMGDPMARNISRTQELIVYDIDKDVSERLSADLGIGSLTSMQDLPDGLEAVVLMVPNSQIVEALLGGDEGILNRVAPGALILDMSSSDPASTRALAGEADRLGRFFVDAPVSGGVVKAKSGELAIMAGGTDAAFARALPILNSVGVSIHHVGEAGAGHAAKALNNLLSATNIAAAAEVLVSAARFGIAAEKMLDVINASTGRSQASEVKFRNFVLPGSFASGFSMDLMLKDLSIAKSLTSGAGLMTPVTDSAAQVARLSREYAGSPPDHTEIVRYYEHSSSSLLRSELAVEDQKREGNE